MAEKVNQLPDVLTDEQMKALEAQGKVTSTPPPVGEGLTDAQMAELEKNGSQTGSQFNAVDFLLGTGRGMGKQLATWGTAPSRVLSYFGVPGYKDLDYSWTQPNPNDYGEQIGANLVGAVPYAAAGFGGAGLMAKASPMIRSALPGAKGVIADWLARGGVGAATDAAAAGLNQEDPMQAAKMGAAFPMAAQPLAAAAGPVGDFFKRGAQVSMGRAVGANFLNRSKKYVLENIIDPLLSGKNLLGEKTRSVFWTLRQLEDAKRASAKSAVTGRDAIRATLPADYSVTYGDVLDAAESAKAEFRPIQAGGGAQVTGDSDRKAIARIGDLVDEIRKTKIDPAISNLDVEYNGNLVKVSDLPIDVLREYKLMPDPNTGVMILARGDALNPQINLGQIDILPNLQRDAPILFDVLEDFKQEWSGFARTHGKYQGKKMVGMVPEGSYDVEAQFQMANKLRELLKQNMPERWDLLNRQYHLDTEIANLAEQRWLGKMGAQQQLSETMMGELPTTLPMRAIARGYIKMLHSPGWNSAMAHVKQFVGENAGRGMGKQGFLGGAAAAFLTNERESGAVTSATEGEPLNIFSQTAQPAEQPVQGEIPTEISTQPQGQVARPRLRWDQDSQQFVPVQ